MIDERKKDFPIFGNCSVSYLDNAATTQKPSAVLERLREFYEFQNANPLRGLYELAETATLEYEKARETAARFINADADEIIFTRNATESLNLAAYSLSELLLKPGDEIVISILEHHSNLLPWQQAARRKGAVLKFIDVKGPHYTVTEEDLKAVLTERTKIVAMTQISNVLGCKNDIKKLAAIAHEAGAVFVADGAQSVPHIPVDVKELDVDFLAFSGHKMLAPMGIGVLYGKKKLLEEMPPFLFGGEMIEYVSREGATYAEVPHKFEAGTVNAGDAVALAEAIRYMEKVGFSDIMAQEEKLTRMAMEGIRKIPHVKILGSQDPEDHYGIVTFQVEGVHPHDVAEMFSADHIAVRAGHHCAQPLHQYLGVPSSTRISLAFYNTEDDIRRFLDTLATLRRQMGYGE